jgi:fatty acid desaturase
MSDDEGPMDATDFLHAVYRKTRAVTSGKYGNRGLTGLSRVGLLLVILAFGGPILWAALWSMPTVLVVFIGSVVVFRLGRWFYRQGYFRR